MVGIERDLDSRAPRVQRELAKVAQRVGVPTRGTPRGAPVPHGEPEHAGAAAQRIHGLAQRSEACIARLRRELGVGIVCGDIEHRVGGEHVEPARLHSGARPRQVREIPADAVEAELGQQQRLLLGSPARSRVHCEEAPLGAVRARLVRLALRARDEPATLAIGGELELRHVARVVFDARPERSRSPRAQLARSAIGELRELDVARDKCRDLARIALGLRPNERAEQLACFVARRGLAARERERVLPGEARLAARTELARPCEAVRRHLAHELRLAHRVLRLDRHRRILRAKLDDDRAPVRLQGVAHAPHHAHGMREFVVHVDHQHEVAALRRQARIVDGRLDELDVVEAELCRANLQQREHLRLQVDREHEALAPHRPREGQRVITVATAEVAHRLARRDTEPALQRRAVLLVFARLAHQPVRAEPVHGLRDLTPEIARAPLRRRLRILHPHRQRQHAPHGARSVATSRTIGAVGERRHGGLPSASPSGTPLSRRRGRLRHSMAPEALARGRGGP